MREMGVNRRTTFGTGQVSRRGRRFLVVVVVVIVGFLSSLYVARALAIRHLQSEITLLMSKEKAALREQASLRERLAHKDDPAAIEDVARAQLGLVKPGEEKVIFVREGD